ncbi:MAG: hypothetical protein K8R58_00375 [Bacteroidales bacterium]|nr:hypothetical protein [Bacteroidales bacterium]
MKNFLYLFFYLLLLSPIISYFAVEGTGRNADYYFRIATTGIGLLFLIINSKKIKIPRYLFPLIFYIIYLAIWATQNGEIERRSLFNYFFNNVNIQILFILIIINNTKFDSFFINNSIKVIKLTIIIAFAISFIQLIYDTAFFTPKKIIEDNLNANIYQVRRTSIFAYVHQTALGLSFLPLVSILLGTYLVHDKKNFYPFLIMAGIVAIASNTRYIIAGLLIVLFQILVSRGISLNKSIKWFIYVGVIVFVVFQVFEFIGYDLKDFYNQRLFAEGSFKKTTRYLAYEMFLKFFPKSWFWGTGVHLTDEIKHEIGGRSSQIHLGYLSHLVSYGIFGSFLYFFYLYLFARDLYSTAKKTSFYGAYFAFLIFLWANMTLVYYSVYTYGLIFAFIFNKYFKDNFWNKSKSSQT